jgi:imidazolonepropionase-like amidohydrolase
MKKILLGVVLLFFPWLAHSNDRPIVLAHVTVIDCTGSASQNDMTVVIEKDRITEIQKATKIQVPKNAQVIESSGKFLIPGLWDAHVHWQDKRYLPLFIANGVTGIRLMWGMAEHKQWQKEVNERKLIGPRMLIASTILDGPKPLWPGSAAISDAAQGKEAVDREKKDGADFIKAYSRLPREAYFAIAQESKNQQIPFVGHVPYSITVREASEAGQKSIEHLTGFLLASSKLENELRKELLDSLQKTPPNDLEVGRLQAKRLLESYDDQKAASLISQLAKNKTWQCPTMTVLRSFGMLNDSSFTNDPRLKYMPNSIRVTWDPKNDFRLASRTAEDWENSKKIFLKQIQIVGAMNGAGIPILAGTDVGNPFCFPGFSLHDELGLLVQAGLSPMKALQTATRNAAEFSGFADTLGTIKKGKIADLVLLNADPLQDINNTRSIEAVIFGGKLIQKDALQQMLASIEKLANKPSIAGVIMKTLQEKGAQAAINQYHELKETQFDVYEFGEDELALLGYQLLAMKKLDEAIAVLQLNVEAFPQSANAYDSLAEIFMIKGDKEAAIRNYKKSLELNPKNQNALDKMKQLQNAEPH